MSELLSRLDGGEIIGLVAVGGSMLTVLVAILGGLWHRNRLTSLKHEMVSRGMSADEIQTVLNAGSHHGQSNGRRRHSCGA